jgi:protein FRG1
MATLLPTGGHKISLKSAFERYLSTDKFGVVTCDTEAVGPTEEWEIVTRDDGMGLISARGKFLSADESGAKGSASAVARADSDEMKFTEVFKIRCQAQNKIKSRKRKAETVVDATALEVEQMYVAVLFLI